MSTSSTLPTTPYTPGSGNFSSCPNPPFKSTPPPPAPPPSVQNVAPNAKGLLGDLNLGGCKTYDKETSSSYSIGGFSADLMGGFYGHGTSESHIHTTSGCENIALLAQHYSNTVNAVYCAIQETKTSSTTTIQDVNSISIQAGPYSEINFDCGAGGFNIIQGENMNISIIDSQKITQKVIDNINHTITNGITNWAKAAGQQAMNMGSSPDKTNAQLNLINENINKASFDNQSTIDLQSMSQYITLGNSITITTAVGSKIFITGDKCSISQDVVLKISIENTVSSAFSRALQGVDLPTLFPSPPEPSGGGSSSKKSLISMPVIIAIVVLLIAAGLAYYFLVMKKKPTMSFSFY